VEQDRWVAVESFGEFQEIKGPGLAWTGCDCCGMCIGLRAISNRIEQNDCAVETKTKDNVFVTVRVSIQQSVIEEHAKEAIYKLTNVDSQIDSYVADVVRSQVPKMTLDEAFAEKDTISNAIKHELDVHMKDYGFRIHKTLVTDVRPAKNVMEAMDEINRQARLRDAEQMKAEAEKIKIVTAAEASAESARLQGVGIAQQRSAIIEGLRSSVTQGTGEVLTSEKVSELLLITQYFETLRDIGAQSKASAVFIPQSPGQAINDIASQIRNGVLQASAAPTQSQML
jgi:regulator of protease activity HflC (stomatin/prohibitin superfamily)